MDATEHRVDARILPNSNKPESPSSREGNRRRRDRRVSSRVPGPNIQQLASPAYCCDLSGAVVSHNQGAVELWGKAPNPTLLFQWSGAAAILDLEGAPLPRSAYPCAQAVATGADVDVDDLWIERHDGSRVRVAAHARPLRDAATGAVVGGFCMFDDLAERDRLADELRKRDDGKDAFLSMLAHELRNPLAPILTAACLMRKFSSDGRILGMADMVERQAKQLSRFVGDLLDASNLAQDGIEVVPRAISATEVFECAMDELRPKARARRQRVDIDFGAVGETLVCDPERTAQALANVMLNASAFTSEGGEIRIRVRVEGSVFEVVVEDTGVGIAPAHLGDLFKPYSQFATHAGRLKAGAGLGLAIAKDICERQGGHISASSAGLGKGSVFKIALPVVAAIGA